MRVSKKVAITGRCWWHLPLVCRRRPNVVCWPRCYWPSLSSSSSLALAAAAAVLWRHQLTSYFFLLQVDYLALYALTLSHGLISLLKCARLLKIKKKQLPIALIRRCVHHEHLFSCHFLLFIFLGRARDRECRHELVFIINQSVIGRGLY